VASLVKSSIIVTLLNGISLLVGFVSNLVVAKTFGTSLQMDAFQVSSVFPQFLITIISGSLGYTFIPVLADRKKESEADAWGLVSTLINLLTLVGALIVMLSVLFADPLMRLLAPGFGPDQLADAAVLLRWQMPIVALSILNELMSSVYYSKGNFTRPMVFKAISPCLTILYVILFSSQLNVLSLVIAQLTTTVLQTGILAYGFLKEKDFHYVPRIDLKDPSTIKVLRLMLPLLAGMSVYKIIPLLERWMASDLPAGSISTLGYAWKLVSILLPLASAGITVSIFPEMARLKAEGDLLGLKQVMSKGIRTLIFLNMPIVFLLGIHGTDVVGLMMERGAFTHSDTIATATIMGIYLLGLPAGAVGSIIGQGYYVFKDTRTPVAVGLLEVALYAVVAWFLLPRLGIFAIPATYAIYINASIMVNTLFVRAKFGNTGGAGILRSMGVYSALSGAMSLMVYLANAGINNLYMRNFFVAVGFAGYLGINRFVLKSEEAVIMWDRMFIPLWRRIGGLFHLGSGNSQLG
jgi:putative peptidoglycan lipid II flippase